MLNAALRASTFQTTGYALKVDCHDRRFCISNDAARFNVWKQGWAIKNKFSEEVDRFSYRQLGTPKSSFTEEKKNQ